MKKILIMLMAVIMLTLFVAPAALAAGSGDYVFDETGILTSAQIDALNDKAAALSEKRKCEVYIWLTDLVPEEYAKTTDVLEAYVQAFFDWNDLGYGKDKNGMVLLLETGDMPGERDYHFYANGRCESVFNNSARQELLDDKIVPRFVSAFNDGNFYNVANTFLDEVENKFASDFTSRLTVKLVVIILVPVLIALIACGSMKRKMKTAVTARAADNYIPAGGFKLTAQTDQFLYRTTTRVKIEKPSSSSSSGGSGSSSSGKSSGGKV